MDQSPGERLKDLIANMALKNSYWGYLFARVRRVGTENIPSIMGVKPTSNGLIELMYHPELVATTDNAALKKILEHEGMHILQKHISRLLRIISNEPDKQMQAIKVKIWNIAADCAVNPVIEMPNPLQVGGRPFEGCFPSLYDMKDFQASEYYYNKLLKSADIQKIKINLPGGESGEGDESGLGGEFDVIGDHSEWDKVTDQTSDVSALSRKVDAYVQKIIKESVKNFANKRRGLLPAYIRELIDQALLPPKVPYYQIIRKLVRGTRLSKFKRAFAKVNRKRTFAFALDDTNLPVISPFPGRARDFSFHIVVLIDTSGSMSVKDIAEGLSGVKSIIEKDRHCLTTVIENDTQIGKEYEVKKIRDIQFDVTGRGGTVLKPGLERARELKPDVVLCFTDGYCENVNNLDKKTIPRKIIWVIQKDGTVENVNKSGYIVRI